MQHLNPAGLLACGCALVAAIHGRPGRRWIGIVFLMALLCSILLWVTSEPDTVRCIALDGAPPCTVGFPERWGLAALTWAFLTYSTLIMATGVTGILIRRGWTALKRRHPR